MLGVSGYRQEKVIINEQRSDKYAECAIERIALYISIKVLKVMLTDGVMDKTDINCTYVQILEWLFQPIGKNCWCFLESVCKILGLICGVYLHVFVIDLNFFFYVARIASLIHPYTIEKFSFQRKKNFFVSFLL